MKVTDLVANALKNEGVGFITGFPHNQIIDACSDIDIRPIMARTERVAINMADGYSRMKAGQGFGVAAVQFGPGSENGFGAIAQAYADASPVLVLPGGYESREAGVTPNFSAKESLGTIAKEVMSLNYPDLIPLFMQRAFGLLKSGKPGPVVVEVPDDLMKADAGSGIKALPPVQISQSQADPKDIERVLREISKANAPVLMAGRGVLHSGAWGELRTLAEVLRIPVVTTLAGKSGFPENHPLSLGTGGLSRPEMVDQFLEEADLVIGVGTSFTRSHYTTPASPGTRLIQITNDPQDVSKSFPIESVLVGDLGLVLQQLQEAAADMASSVADLEDSPVVQRLRARKDAFLKKWMPRLTTDEEPISPYRVVWELMQVADRSKTVITHDSGNPRDQIVPFFETITPLGYIGWGKSTQLGTGLGLIMGAKLAKPDWLAVNLMGDSSFGMVGMDLETAVRCEIPILTVVLNNGLMGGYEDHLPIATRKHAVHLQGGKYADVATALGARGQRVEKIRDLEPALRRAIEATQEGQPALVEVMTRPEPIFPMGSYRH